MDAETKQPEVVEEPEVQELPHVTIALPRESYLLGYRDGMREMMTLALAALIALVMVRRFYGPTV